MFVVFCSPVQTLPCDSKPCLNGAACSNDVEDITKYHCKCTGDFSGVNCQGKLRGAMFFVPFEPKTVIRITR